MEPVSIHFDDGEEATLPASHVMTETQMREELRRVQILAAIRIQAIVRGVLARRECILLAVAAANAAFHEAEMDARQAAEAEEAQGSSLGTSAAAVAACARGTSVGSVAATAASACGALAAAVATCARGASRRSGAVRHGEPRRHSRHGHPCHGHADDDRHPRRGGGRARLHVMTVSTMSRAQELTPLHSTLRRVLVCGV